MRRDRRKVLAAFATLAAASAAGCLGDGDGNPVAGDAEGEGDLRIASPAFEDGATIPERYTRDGENVNPPLTVEGVPGDAESLVLVVDDPDAPDGTFDHWLVWNVPPDVGTIPEAWDPPAGVVQGENDFGNVRYDGPAPPSEHRYRFKLYALDATLDLSAGAGKDRLGDAVDGHVLARAQLTGTYGG